MADEEVMAELAQLRKRLGELEARVASAQPMPMPQPSPPLVETTSPGTGAGLSRRAALKALGGVGLVAGAGLAAGVTVAASASPAAAANGASLIVGANTNAASAPTGLEVTGNNQPYGFGVTDNGLSSIPVEIFEPAILGHAKDEAFDIGVVGYNATINPGVLGYSATGTGVWGRSGGEAGSTGVLAESVGGVGVAAKGAQGALLLEVGNATAPPMRTGEQFLGVIDVDEVGNVWLCVETTPVARWVRLGGPGVAGALTVLPATVRVYDSRPGTRPANPGPKGPLVAGIARAVDVTANLSGVPVTASAVVVNATIVPIAIGGYFALYKNGIPYPDTSTLNWSAPGHPIANGATVAINNGKLDAFASEATNFFIDVIGYYL